MTKVTTLKTVDDINEDKAANDTSSTAEMSSEKDQGSMDVTALMDMLKGRDDTKQQRSRKGKRFSLGIKTPKTSQEEEEGARSEHEDMDDSDVSEAMTLRTVLQNREDDPGERSARTVIADEQRSVAEAFRESIPAIFFGVVIIAAFIGMLYFVDRQSMHWVNEAQDGFERPVITIPETETRLPARISGKQPPAQEEDTTTLQRIAPAAGGNDVVPGSQEDDDNLLNLLIRQ